MPPIDAFGIGGSYGRGDADRMSDLDFFVILPSDAFWEGIRHLPTRIEHALPVLSDGVGRFISDYGFRVGFLLAGNRKVEYYFNSPDSMTRLPLSARIRVLEDRSGWLTETLARARAQFEADPRPHVAAAVHDCLLDIHDLRKHASRGDLLPMIWRVNSLRREILALHHMSVSGEVYAPSSAASQLEARAGEELRARAEDTVPAADRASIATAYSKLRALMLTAWAYFEPTGVPTPEQQQAERELSEELLRLLA